MKKWVIEKFKGLNVALKLQAKEYERRLNSLNGEAGQLKQMQATYTPRETFERTLEQLRKDIESLMVWKIKQEGKSQLLQYIPWLLTLISLWLLYTKR